MKLKNKTLLTIICGLLLAFISLFFISKTLFFYIAIFYIPGLLLARFLPKIYFNRFDKIILAPIFGLVISSIIGIFFNTFHITINANNLIVIYTLIFIIGFWVWTRGNKSQENSKYKIEFIKILKNRWPYLVATGIFILFALAKILPTFQVLAPNGMDIVAHGIWARKIIDSGKIEYFYSPGLHIGVAFSYLLSGETIAKNLLYITNFFNAYLSLMVFIFAMKIFKNRTTAILASFLTASAIYPTLFYQSAGKNALVLALPLMIVGILLSYLLIFDFQRDNKSLLIFNNVVFFALGIIHYPTAFLLLAFYAAIFVTTIFQKDKEKLNKIKILIYSFLPALILVAIWSGVHFKGSYDSQISNLETISFVEGLKLFGRSIKDIFIQYQISQEYFYPVCALVFAVFAFLIKTRVRVFVFWNLIILFSWFVVKAFHLNSAGIIISTSIAIYLYLILPLIIYFFDFVIRKIKWREFSFWLIIVMAVFSVLAARKAYKQYLNFQSDGSIVTEADIKAYNWIEKNIPANRLIINNAVKGQKNIVFSLDGGAWIPVYTHKNIAMPFFEFRNPDIQKNYLYFRDLMANPQNKNILKTVKKQNIHYIYIGSRGVAGNIIDYHLFENNNFQLVYNKNKVRIYQIK